MENDKNVYKSVEMGFQIHANENFFVNEFEQLITYGHTKCPNGLYIVEKQLNKSGLLNAESLVYVEDGKVPILLLNPMDSPIELTKGTTITNISPVGKDTEIIPLGTEYIRSVNS